MQRRLHTDYCSLQTLLPCKQLTVTEVVSGASQWISQWINVSSELLVVNYSI